MTQSYFDKYEEDENLNQERNGLLDALGVSAISAGTGAGAIGLEIGRRKKEGKQTTKQATKELQTDAKTALDILLGRTPLDKGGIDARSIRDVGNRSTPDSFYYTEGDFRDKEGSLVNNPAQDYRKNPLSQMAVAARDAYQPSSEDFLSTQREFRTSRGHTAEGPRSSVAFTRMPGVDAYRDLAAGKLPGGFSADEMNHRREVGMDLMNANARQGMGAALGRGASDFINNGIRSFWWLINAPQAVSDLISEETAGRANNFGLYGQDLFDYDSALKQNLIDENGKPLNNSINIVSDNTQDPFLLDQIDKKRTAVRNKAGKDPLDKKNLNVYGRRRTGNNLSTLLALPGAIGINAGLGLVNPIGGSDGYKAVMPDEDDPTKTRNVLGEVAQKYFLGRRGDILPWSEFKKVRPDVTKEDYQEYKAYKWSKGIDLNPFDDGDFNLGGILKGTDDGIDGGELMFLGKHMPTNTVLLPTAAAIGGAALGAALGRGGSLNVEGISEGIDRKSAQKNIILKKYGLPTMNIPEDAVEKSTIPVSDADKKILSDIDREVENRLDRMRFLEGDFGVNSKDPSKRPSKGVFNTLGIDPDKMRRRSPITLGLALGGAALAGSSLIGGEIERRRREQKIQENNSFDYNALNIS